jgi:hypothetical protein
MLMDWKAQYYFIKMSFLLEFDRFILAQIKFSAGIFLKK